MHPDSEQSRWFAENLQPHEPMLRAWLTSRFSGEHDVEDTIQEAYVRVLQARKSAVIKSPKAFLFAIARNIALARLRHQRVTGEKFLAEMEAAGILDESADVPLAAEHAQELEILTLAIQSLPARCRQVLTLRKIYGLSQREVATQLGISEHTVEAQSTIGLHKLSAFFARYERRGLGA